jgi:hypothetical protein
MQAGDIEYREGVLQIEREYRRKSNWRGDEL